MKIIIYCYKVCKHNNYCVKLINHKDKHLYHNSLKGLKYKHCDC